MTIQFIIKLEKNNIAPDALSRKSDLAALTGISQPVQNFVQEIQQACLLDPDASAVIQQLSQGQVSKPHFSVVNSQLLYKGRIFVPTCDNWRSKILIEFHGGLTGGHAGVARTYKRIKRSFA